MTDHKIDPRSRKLDQVSETLEDVAYDADELRSEIGDSPNGRLVDELLNDLEDARDLVDDIVESED